MTISEAIHQGLDLGFSDYFPGENVREKTIAGDEKRVVRAVAISHAEEAVCYSFFKRLGSKHPAAELYALDFPSDLRGSLYLLLGGYYKQSLICQRTWLEMRMLGIYFGFVSPDRTSYDAWKLGNEEAPFGSGLIHRLFGRAEFQRADARVSLRARLKEVYSTLSAFIHGGGVEKYNLQRDTDNVPRYNDKSVIICLDLLEATFSQVMYISCVAFGRDAFADVDAESNAAILERLPGDYASEIRAVLP